jgi:RHS repeat-associated protein
MEDQQDASGLLYRRNRYYDPATGRFTQEDPIGLAGGLNLYGFAAGDPVTYGDPYGLCPDPTAMGLGSLQCAIQDIVGALRASPRIMAGFVSEAVENPFLRRLGSIPFTFAGGGGGAVVGGVRRATVVEGHIARIGAKLANQLSHVDARHLQIAKAEMRGAQTGYDHVTEVNEAMGGLRNTIGDLNRILADERLTRDERGAAQRLLSMASRALDRAEDYLSR